MVRERSPIFGSFIISTFHGTGRGALLRFLALFLCVTPCLGQERLSPRGEPLATASSFLGREDIHEVGNPLSIGLSPAEIYPEALSPTYRIYAGDDGKGFVVVSGKRGGALPEVLAYSEEGSFSYDDMSPSLLWWLSHIREGARRASDSKASAVIGTQPQRTLRSTGEGKVLSTATWGQGTPFNDKCPLMSDGKSRAVTGCTATAFGIIMRYHKWPSRGSGSSVEYKNGDNTEPVHSVEHTYLWDRMPLSYQGTYTPDEAAAVSTLLLDLAYLVQSTFGSESTSASVSHFGDVVSRMDYDRRAVLLGRYSMNEDLWTGRIRSSIDGGVPVLYCGVNNKDEGHAFVVDGYDPEGLFHINWGWNGKDNGYFAFPDFGEFSSRHSALFDFVPNEGAEAEPYLGFYNEMIPRGVASSKKGRIIRTGDSLTLSFGMVTNCSAVPFVGSISFALVHESGDGKVDVAEFLGSPIVSDGLLPSWGYQDVKKTCKILGPITHGDRIALLYSSEGSGTWKQVVGAEDCGVVSEIRVYSDDVLDFTSLSYDSQTSTVQLISRGGTTYEFSRGGTVLLSGTISETDYPIAVDVSSLVGGESCTLTLRWNNLRGSLNIKL